MSQIATWRGLEVGILGYWHHGVLMPDGTVIHFTGVKHGKRNARIVRTVLSDFAKRGADVYDVVYEESDLLPADEVVRRAESRLGHTGYDLLFNNCESFAKWCVVGREVSDQSRGYLDGIGHGLQREGTVAGALVGAVVAAFMMPFNGARMVRRGR